MRRTQLQIRICVRNRVFFLHELAFLPLFFFVSVVSTVVNTIQVSVTNEIHYSQSEEKRDNPRIRITLDVSRITSKLFTHFSLFLLFFIFIFFHLRVLIHNDTQCTYTLMAPSSHTLHIRYYMIVPRHRERRTSHNRSVEYFFFSSLSPWILSFFIQR